MPIDKFKRDKIQIFERFTGSELMQEWIGSDEIKPWQRLNYFLASAASFFRPLHVYLSAHIPAFPTPDFPFQFGFVLRQICTRSSIADSKYLVVISKVVDCR